jgi:hypothetical protein
MLPAWEIKMLEAELEKRKQELFEMREVKDNEAITRLAAYEDSGLSPEEVQELAKAKADGRLVELPVKVGDTIYFPDHYNKRVDSRLITGIRQNTSGTWQAIGGLLCFPFSSFGVSIFLTREAAEKALEVGE